MHYLPHQGLYAITDCENLGTSDLLEYSTRILVNGATLFQYRNKHDAPEEKYNKANQLQTLCHDFNVPFIINDDIKLAQTLSADGIHLGKDDLDCRIARAMLGPECIIGVSCYNNLQRAVKAVSDGASYVAFGAFFATKSKKQTVAADVNLLQSARQVLSVPVAAIGGITPENGLQLINAGADYLAVISGLYSSSDPAEATRQYVNLFKQE